MAALTKSSPLVKNKQITNTKDQPKQEGTSTTYGQNISVVASAKTVASTTTSQAKGAGTTPSEHNITQSVPVAKPIVTNDVPFVSSPVEIVHNTPIVPQDTIVKVVQSVEQVKSNLLGNVSIVNDTSKSNIAIVAVSNNSNAVAVVPPKSIISPPDVQTNIVAPILNVVSNVTPNVTDMVVVKGSGYKTKDEQKTSLSEAKKVDLSISMKSLDSESVEFNTLKIPDLLVNFVYNFFEETEEDLDIQEDQLKDPLLLNKPVDVPRYATFSWNPIKVTETLTGTEAVTNKNKDMRNETFASKKGTISYNSSNFKDSVSKSKKDINNIVRNGVDVKIVDVHSVEVGFDSIANQKSFSNTLSTTVNVQSQKNVINNLPVIPKTVPKSSPKTNNLSTTPKTVLKK
jgi:hypothetical protein